MSLGGFADYATTMGGAKLLGKLERALRQIERANLCIELDAVVGMLDGPPERRRRIGVDELALVRRKHQIVMALGLEEGDDAA